MRADRSVRCRAFLRQVRNRCLAVVLSAMANLFLCSSAIAEEARAAVREIRLPQHAQKLWTSGDLLLTTTTERTRTTIIKRLQVWDWRDLAATPKLYPAGETSDVAWSDRGMIVDTPVGSGGTYPDHVLQIIDPPTGKTVEIRRLGPEWYVEALASTCNGKYHACLLVFQWNVADADNLAEATTYGLGLIESDRSEASLLRPIVHRNLTGQLAVKAVAVSQDGRLVAAAGSLDNRGWIQLADPRKGTSLWAKAQDGSYEFDAVAFSPDGKVIYAAGRGACIYVFDAVTGRALGRWSSRLGEPNEFGPRISGLAASPDGLFVVGGCVYDAATGKVAFALVGNTAACHSPTFSTDSHFLAAADPNGGTASIWAMPDSWPAAPSQPTIFDAVRQGETASLRTFLQNKALLSKKASHVDTRDGFGRTALHWALMAGREDCTRILRDSGADLNATDFGGWTPLHYWASGDGDRKVAQLLLEWGADVNIRAKGLNGWTSLQWAAYAGQPEVAADLLAYGADVNARDDHLRTPLHLAAAQGHAGVAGVLLKHGADAALRTKYGGNTPLHLAAEQGAEDVVQVLLAGGAKVDVPSEHGQTPLIVAAEANQPKVAALLLAKGANVNASAGHGTALHIASLHGFKELAGILMAYNADTNAVAWGPLYPATTRSSRHAQCRASPSAAGTRAGRDHAADPCSSGIITRRTLFCCG